MRSWTDYILGKYRCLFGNVSIQDPRHNSYQYLVLGCLHSVFLRKHTEYLRRGTQNPLRPLTTPKREDEIFAAPRRAIPKPKARKARKNTWILKDMWRIIDKRVYLRRDPVQSQAFLQRLIRAINAILKGDRRRRI